MEYEDYIRNEAEIKEKVGKLEKDLKVESLTLKTNWFHCYDNVDANTLKYFSEDVSLWTADRQGK